MRFGRISKGETHTDYGIVPVARPDVATHVTYCSSCGKATTHRREVTEERFTNEAKVAMLRRSYTDTCEGCGAVVHFNPVERPAPVKAKGGKR